MADPAGVRSRYKASGMGRNRTNERKYKAVKSTGEAWRESAGSGPHHGSTMEKFRKKLRLPARQKKKRPAVRCVLTRP